jgi:prepilin-type N-terminal cleavage/methylation domain-containing protein
MIVRKEKGFTLVEVIVVAVIVAVLAAVAIPLYMGYIRDSRVNVGNNVGGSLSSACGSTRQQTLTIPAGTVVSPAAPSAPLLVTFPSVSNNASDPNTVIIPNGYTAVISNTTATCYFTTYGNGGGAVVYTFAN